MAELVTGDESGGGGESSAGDRHAEGSSCLSDEEEIRLEKEHFEKIVNALLYYEYVLTASSICSLYSVCKASCKLLFKPVFSHS